ncbi:MULTISPECIES: hypothetical protein [unclassified Geodermatophilus]
MDGVWLWIVGGLLVWAVVAVGLGVLLGRSIRMADRVETASPDDGRTPTTPGPVPASTRGAVSWA